MDVMQLKIAAIYFLAIAEVILVIMLGLIIACKPYTNDTPTEFEVNHRYKSYTNGALVIFIIFGTALMYLLQPDLIGVTK